MRRFAVLAVILSLTACSPGSSDSGTPVVLGLAGPFSQPRGVSMKHAAELAVRELNARGGVRGRALALRIMDDSGRPDVAIRVAQQLSEDPAGVVRIWDLKPIAALAAGPAFR